MRHCPNHHCFHFQAWGKHLEFPVEVEACPECSHALASGMAPEPERTLHIGEGVRRVAPWLLGLALLMLERLPIPIATTSGALHIAHLSQRLRPFVLSVMVLFVLDRLRGASTPLRALGDSPVNVRSVVVAAAFALALVAVDMDGIATGGVVIEPARRVVWTGALVVWSGAYVAAHHLIRRYTKQSGILVLCALDLLATGIHWFARA